LIFQVNAGACWRRRRARLSACRIALLPWRHASFERVKFSFIFVIKRTESGSGKQFPNDPPVPISGAGFPVRPRRRPDF
jgi:hypothetical protein